MRGVTCAKLYMTSQDQLKPIRTSVLGGVLVKFVSSHIGSKDLCHLCMFRIVGKSDFAPGTGFFHAFQSIFLSFFLNSSGVFFRMLSNFPDSSTLVLFTGIRSAVS